jgi:hypothetical protein
LKLKEAADKAADEFVQDNSNTPNEISNAAVGTNENDNETPNRETGFKRKKGGKIGEGSGRSYGKGKRKGDTLTPTYNSNVDSNDIKASIPALPPTTLSTVYIDSSLPPIDVSLADLDFNEIALFDSITGNRIDIKDVLANKIKEERTVLPYPPLLPYHSKSKQPPVIPPYVPTLSSAKATKAFVEKVLRSAPGKSIVKIPGTNLLLNQKLLSPSAHLEPDMTLQKTTYERDNLKLHLCNCVFEAYSASYLTTKEHILAIKSEGYNLTWVNCEMASFIHMKESNNFYKNANGHGLIVQTLDVLDFSAIHLSAFERSSKKYKHNLWKTKNDLKVEWTKIDPVIKAAKFLENLNNPNKSNSKITWSEEANRTVAIMPFLGGAMGAGHSELGNRFEYLKACFWSIYEFIPNIVAGVSRQEDVDWAWKESGLPFYDILLLEGLPKSASLPVATTQQTKRKLQSGEWDFDYVFFTESDQIIISRILPTLHDHLKLYPRRMILPHRLMPYSDRVMIEVHKREIDKDMNKWMHQSCCLQRQNCVERKTWYSIKDQHVPVINYYGLYVPLGNVNFLDEKYRSCKIGPYLNDFCP